MTPENNLIKDYCLENPVAIVFRSRQDLEMISALFDHPVLLPAGYTSGAVSFTRLQQEDGLIRLCEISIIPYLGRSFVYLSSQEFFALALPNLSILEKLK
jgi:hypothetical protein